MGEIVKMNESDTVPCLEVYIENENEKVYPETEFIYLHNVDLDFDEVIEEFKFNIQEVEWSPNIGRSLIPLSFDRSKKYVSS